MPEAAARAIKAIFPDAEPKAYRGSPRALWQEDANVIAGTLLAECERLQHLYVIKRDEAEHAQFYLGQVQGQFAVLVTLKGPPVVP